MEALALMFVLEAGPERASRQSRKSMPTILASYSGRPPASRLK